MGLKNANNATAVALAARGGFNELGIWLADALVQEEKNDKNQMNSKKSPNQSKSDDEEEFDQEDLDIDQVQVIAEETSKIQIEKQ